MSYPGQEYWHAMNPNIRRAEENWEGKVSLQDNDKNKRLHDTIANLERPELLAREWLIEWDKKHKLHPSQDTCVASLAALLAQHAVADVTEAMKSCDGTLERLVKHYAELFTTMTPPPIEEAIKVLKGLMYGTYWCGVEFAEQQAAHAAEQPKLTEEPEFSAKLDGAIKQGIDNWRVWGSSEIQDEGYLRVMLREQIYRLLTSPVAPPPPKCWHKEIDDEGICKNCGAKAAIKLEGMSELSAKGGSAMGVHADGNRENKTAKEAVAPGEQPSPQTKEGK